MPDPDFAGGWVERHVKIDPDILYVHIVPIEDFREHDLKPTCWCRPAEDKELLCDHDNMVFGFMHNAMDQRELIEIQVRRKS